MWHVCVIICAFAYLFANRQWTASKLLLSNFSKRKLNWIHTCEDPGCLSGCHRRADARKLHATRVIQVNPSVGHILHIYTYKTAITAKHATILKDPNGRTTYAVLTSSRVSGPRGGNPRTTLWACEPMLVVSLLSSSLSSSLSLEILSPCDSPPLHLNLNDLSLKRISSHDIWDQVKPRCVPKMASNISSGCT